MLTSTRRAHPAGRTLWRAALLLLVALGALAVTSGCGKSVAPTPPDRPPSPRLTPADAVDALQWAYEHRDGAVYGRILADDFRFYFDPYTTPSTVSEYWTRAQDSTATGNLFRATDITDIRITLTFGADLPVIGPGQERWRRIRVSKTLLDVDRQPPTGELFTYRAEGAQDFFLRRGFTSGDTLATSPTAREWFVVEWHDLGQDALNSTGISTARAPTPASIRSWSALKATFR